jgi:hypothetical protein
VYGRYIDEAATWTCCPLVRGVTGRGRPAASGTSDSGGAARSVLQERRSHHQRPAGKSTRPMPRLLVYHCGCTYPERGCEMQYSTVHGNGRASRPDDLFFAVVYLYVRRCMMMMRTGRHQQPTEEEEKWSFRALQTCNRSARRDINCGCVDAIFT